MTNDQIQFFIAQEQRRHNLANEEEAKRHNVASEQIGNRELDIRDFSAVAQAEYYKGSILNGAKSAAAAYLNAINGGVSAEAAMKQASAALMRVQNDMDYNTRKLIQDANIDALNRELKYKLKEMELESREDIAREDRVSREDIADVNRQSSIQQALIKAQNDQVLQALRDNGESGRKLADQVLKFLELAAKYGARE